MNLQPLSGLLIVLASVAPSMAQVVERDYLTPGDGLLTVDLANQREFHDLSETNLEFFSGSLVEDRYQAVVAATAVGGTFEGFRVATPEEAEALIVAAGITFDPINVFATEGQVVGDFIDLISPTLGASGAFRRSRGLTTGVFVDQFNESRISLAASFEPPQGNRDGFAYGTLVNDYQIRTQTFPNPDTQTYGVLLVRTPFPSLAP